MGSLYEKPVWRDGITFEHVIYKQVGMVHPIPSGYDKYTEGSCEMTGMPGVFPEMIRGPKVYFTAAK